MLVHSSRTGTALSVVGQAGDTMLCIPLPFEGGGEGVGRALMMKRRLLKIFLLVLAGAIVNVAVAWALSACAAYKWTECGLSCIARNGFAGWMTEWRAGLPLHSVVGARSWKYPGPETRDGVWLVRYPVFDGKKTNALWLPYRPIWSGFAINTIFYAAILWMLFAAPFRVRRWRRIRRGLCPVCAYPIGQSPTCTECGDILTKRRP